MEDLTEVEAGEALSLEYTHRLTSQLETQRNRHEIRLQTAKREHRAVLLGAETAASQALSELARFL
jgi:hypothetical protein